MIFNHLGLFYFTIIFSLVYTFAFAPAMNPLQFLALLSLLFIGCNQSGNHPFGDCASDSWANDDSTSATTNNTGRGALLGTRFTSLEDLKTVIQIEYDSNVVFVRHCSKGRAVTSVLATGASQGDILNARYKGAIWKRFSLLFRCPYAVINRKDLEKVFNLSRRIPEWFGEGDPAFFDLAESSVAKINTPDLAFKNARDSTEKGYLNSFNHFTAQAFITSCFSEDVADFIADSHERYRHPELITGLFTAAQITNLEEGPVDNYVDLINNEWGQELGKQLKEKYGIDRETNWSPELLANYLNDLQRYYSWAFQIGFIPYKPEDDVVLRFSKKIDIIMKGRLKLDRRE
ncbi:MAG: hypothetical protein H7246_05655 [Phycisphaerae bacterium]|nr:hypothetical protein [Saprospiraceae bacterium]